MRLNKDYPYMYARVSAKRAKLFDQSDYQNLVKMGPNEITRKLEEGTYQKEINDLGSNHSGVELAELALIQNLAREMKNLSEMADGNLQKVIKTYLRKYDILAIKRILSAKKGKAQTIDNLKPVSSLTKEEIQDLKEKNFQQIKESIKFKESTIDYQERLKESETLSQVQRSLDQAYYDDIIALSQKSGNKQLKEFIEEEIEYENLKIALRLKRYNIEKEEIDQRLLKSDNCSKVKQVMNKDFEEAMKYLIEELELNVEPEIEKVEHALEVHRLNTALRKLHTQPLGLSSILGYMTAKITEVKNLRMLIRAKETDIQNQETIKNQLVLAN
jgi:Archaeal/vacuolar-type H+-ATPase subunit C